MHRRFLMAALLGALAVWGCRSAPIEAALRVLLPASPEKSAGALSKTVLLRKQSPLTTPGVPVVIYLIDTLRIDRIGVYGGSGALTPNVDALAARSVLFEQAYAPAPWTLPSVTSLFTSTFLTEHGVVDLRRVMNPTLRPLARRLVAAGYATAAFTANANTSYITGDGGGYQRAQIIDKSLPPDVARAWLSSVAGRPFHLYVHTTEPHNPFIAPPEWIGRFGAVSDDRRRAVNAAMRAYRDATMADLQSGRAPGTVDNSDEQDRLMADLAAVWPDMRVLYDAHVAQADARLGEFVDLLREAGVWDDCLFILLSDHGEEFGEHGGWLHDQSLHEELVRVPLLIRFPRDAAAGRRVREVARLIDVMPTILDALGMKDETADCRGRSLLPLIDGSAAPPRDDAVHVVSMRSNRTKHYRPFKERRGDLNVALRQGRFKGVWNVEVGTLELYDLENDPGEMIDVAPQQPDRAAAMIAFARDWMKKQRHFSGSPDAAANARPPALDRAAERNLRKLGYLGD
ncbi:MAG: sulfatase-like hydrolase/transferase [Phycisphaerae bacterium]|nr:sulfatase-like hydrolase/transferase [Phycisphaerae bacterium]NUQ47914.1 sulfatase-like hydrolase/transferase [Phycisphaerae bacterium]